MRNDRSIAVLIQYFGFDYLWASDLGGGNADRSCTGRETDQADVEGALMAVILPGGVAPRITDGGIDVLTVNHHGSESSTSGAYMNGAAPEVALIGVGKGQSASWNFPEKDVVENVLLGEASACITAPPAFVLQTEEGSPSGSGTSFRGYRVGNIQVVTDGIATYTVWADGEVTQGANEARAAGLPRTFDIDD